MAWFGGRKKEIWQELARRTQGVYVSGGFWRDDRVQVPLDPWMITLDTYTVSAGQHSHITYTRIRAPYRNPGQFRFKIYRKNIFSGLGKLFGMQNIAVDYPEISEIFILKGSDEVRVSELLDDPTLRGLFVRSMNGMLQVQDKEGWFGAKYPADADLLHFQVQGVIKDLDQLLNLVDLFALCLERLVEIGEAEREHPGVVN